MSKPLDPEIKAMWAIKRALAPLDPAAIKRVLEWATDRFEEAERPKGSDER